MKSDIRLLILVSISSSVPFAHPEEHIDMIEVAESTDTHFNLVEALPLILPLPINFARHTSDA
jgi:hypothetical protein